MNIFKQKSTIEDIAKAFNNNKNKLKAVKTELCCDKGEVICIVNEAVMLRNMLNDLGYSSEEIDSVLHLR